MTSEFARELKRGIASARRGLEAAGEDEADGYRARLAELQEIAHHNGVDLTEQPDASDAGR